MRTAIVVLLLAIGVATVGLFGVPADLEAITQLIFFSLLVVFVVLMVRHLAHDR